MKKKISLILLCASLLLTSCGDDGKGKDIDANFGDDNTSFGENLDNLGAFDGYFEEESSEIEVKCVSGTTEAYTLDGNTLTFGNLTEDSVYSISGKLSGNIIIDIGENFKLDLEMQGFSLVSKQTNPITVLSGNEISLTAKSETENYIYDKREAIDKNDESLYSGAIHSECDLKICGKGSLTLISDNNNGIHTKDDLKVKNLTLFISCLDNSLKGNDSVELTNAKTTLIASRGDGIKTSNSNVSKKGKQRGDITISGGEHNIYAACDGIDAAHNVKIDTDTTVLNIYTDKYSSYSETVAKTEGDTYYIRFSSDEYYYSVKYYNSESDYLWVSAEYHSTASGMHQSYYYYSFPKMSEYSKLKFCIYDSPDAMGSEERAIVYSDYLSINDSYDTLAITARGNQLMYSWTKYTTTVEEQFGRPGGHGGMGGFGEGNSEKSDISTKGIKAANEIIISAGKISIKSYDDAIHANNDTALENGNTPNGNVTLIGGEINIYSNDDGIHADGTLLASGGKISVSHSYEGFEGKNIEISGGEISVTSKDDGFNSTATTGQGIILSGGNIYIFAGGDGIDSNSRSSYSGIVFSGADVTVISTSGGNSAIDTEAGYSYLGGCVLAIMPSGGMASESTHCNNFSSIGTKKKISLSEGDILKINADGKEILLEISVKLSGMVIYLGSNAADISIK